MIRFSKELFAAIGSRPDNHVPDIRDLGRLIHAAEIPAFGIEQEEQSA
jgi:hypothetical protein